MTNEATEAELFAYKLALYRVKRYVSELVYDGYFSEDVAEPVIKYVDNAIFEAEKFKNY